MTKTALLDVHSNDRIVSIDRRSITVRVDEWQTADMDYYQLPVSNLEANGDEFVVYRIAGHDVINGKTLYRV